MKNKIKYLKVILMLTFLIAVLFRCKKDESTSLRPVKDIYLAGYETDGTILIAKYWKNGTAFSLGINSSYANGIVVSGTDVYIAGSEFNGKSIAAKYWKNGIAVALTDGGKSSNAMAITVSGSDVYVAGSETNGTNYVAKYWKNGKMVLITDGSNYAALYDIAVAGNDVYVAGYENNGTRDVAAIGKASVIHQIAIRTATAATLPTFGFCGSGLKKIRMIRKDISPKTNPNFCILCIKLCQFD